jgi:5-methylcytosine-specific restriction endonuclease McrA
MVVKTKKRCKKCKELKVVTEFPKGTKSHGVQKYKDTCNACSSVPSTRRTSSKKTLKRVSSSVDHNVSHRVCRICGKDKPIDEFFTDRIVNGVQRYRGECKLCFQDVAKFRTRKYRTLKASLVATLTDKEWKQAQEHWNGMCAYCGVNDGICQEHVIPVSAGGSYAADNIVPACDTCNKSKGPRDMKTWFSGQSYYTHEKYMKIVNFLENHKK